MRGTRANFKFAIALLVIHSLALLAAGVVVTVEAFEAVLSAEIGMLVDMVESGSRLVAFLAGRLVELAFSLSASASSWS